MDVGMKLRRQQVGGVAETADIQGSRVTRRREQLSIVFEFENRGGVVG